MNLEQSEFTLHPFDQCGLHCLKKAAAVEINCRAEFQIIFFGCPLTNQCGHSLVCIEKFRKVRRNFKPLVSLYFLERPFFFLVAVQHSINCSFAGTVFCARRHYFSGRRGGLSRNALKAGLKIRWLIY